MKIVHLSIDDDSEDTNSDKEENNDENSPEAPYDGENMNAYYDDDEGNNDEDAPETPYDCENDNFKLIISKIMMRLPPTHIHMIKL